MGLDISYYREAVRLRDTPEDGDYDNAAGEFFCYVNPHFVDQADGLTDGIYHAADGDGFRAGGYGGYNSWRADLARLAGYTDDQAFAGRVDAKLPFVPLVNFSDCEGIIGPVTSARLAADFASLQAVADRHPDEWFRQKYAAWRSAFEVAASNGLVHFH